MSVLPRPEPRDAFKRALRAQLMAQAPGILAPRETVWSRFVGTRGAWLRPALVAAAVVLLIAAGTGKAAADSLPGDAAFPLKRAAEQLQLAFALDDTTRLRLLAEQADHRLAELAEAIAARPEKAPVAETEYATAVKTLTNAVDVIRSQPNVSEDKKNDAEDVVDAAHQKHLEILDQLKKRVAPSKRAEVDDEIDRAKNESEKLRASDRPAVAPGASNRPARTRSPQPARTAQPTRTPEQQNNDDNEGQPARSPQPTRTPGSEGGRAVTPTPSPRR